MLKSNPGASITKVTFVLSLSDAPDRSSVVGDFNGWDPLVHPLKKRSNGTRSVSVEVASGGEYCFKYLDEHGSWFLDPDADAVVNEYGETNSVLRT